MNTLEHALAYAARGWAVFPLVPGDKTPSTGEGGLHLATKDPDGIRAGWAKRPGCGVGINCTKSGVVAVDLDMKHGKDGERSWKQLLADLGLVEPETFEVTTPSGGRHLYFAALPGKPCPSFADDRHGEGIDLRGEGGYVVAPPTSLPYGEYVVTRDVEPLPIPEVLADLFRTPKRPGGATYAGTAGAPAYVPQESDQFAAPGNGFEDAPDADADETLARVRHLADELAAWKGGAAVEAFRRGSLVGGYVAAGQISYDDALSTLMGAFDDWEFDPQASNPNRRAMVTQVRNGLAKGMLTPRAWKADAVPFGEATSLEGGEGTPTAHLPADFWDERPALGHIKQAAHARLLSPDAVLGAVLVRLSSMIKPSVRVLTGLGAASCNEFAILVGHAGSGKSQAAFCARDLIPGPGDAKYRDMLPLGSGEGLAEAYYGAVQEKAKDADGNEKGRAKTVRKQVRENALFFADEGEALSRMLERSGATVGQAIRSAWSGSTLGQANGSADRTRVLDAGSYGMGLIIGYQPSTVGPMLGEAGGGTPQRFLWLNAVAAELPERPAPWPGALENIRHALPTTDITVPEAVAEEIYTAHRAARLAEADEGMDAHARLHRAKVAALLAVLDFRAAVTDDDWRLAGVVWEATRAVRDGLAARIATEAKAAAAAATARTVETAARSAVASAKALRAVEDVDVHRVTRKVADLVHGGKAQAIAGRAGVRNLLAGRDRAHLEDAITEAVRLRWISLGDDGDQLVPGEARPTS